MYYYFFIYHFVSFIQFGFIQLEETFEINQIIATICVLLYSYIR